MWVISKFLDCPVNIPLPASFNTYTSVSPESVPWGEFTVWTVPAKVLSKRLPNSPSTKSVPEDPWAPTATTTSVLMSNYLCSWPQNLHFLRFQMAIILSWPLLKRIIEGKNFARWTLASGAPYGRLLAFLHADLDVTSPAHSLSCIHSFPLGLPALHPFRNPSSCCLSRLIAGPSFIMWFTGHWTTTRALAVPLCFALLQIISHFKMMLKWMLLIVNSVWTIVPNAFVELSHLSSLCYYYSPLTKDIPEAPSV